RRRCALRARDRPPPKPFVFPAPVRSITASISSSVPKLFQNVLVQLRCSKNLLVFIGIAVELRERLPHHLQLRLAVEFQQGRIALTEHLGDDTVSDATRAQPRGERMTQLIE